MSRPSTAKPARTLVLGAAVSGRAAAGLARRLGHDVAVYDRDESALGALGSDVATFGGEWDRRLLEGRDLVVTSPGIPLHAPPIVDSLATEIRLISEMEFGYEHLGSPCVAVTGTNGKTTVTATAAAMLEASGYDAVAAGNIGLAVSDVAGAGHDVVVIEASSFQLQFIDTFHPAAAAILNIAPDHLDWHGNLATYAAAKRRIGENQGPGDIIVFDVDDAPAAVAVAGLAARAIPVSGNRRPPGGNGPSGEELHVGDVVLPRPPLDNAFTMDLTAAATLAQHMNASVEAIEKVISGFSTGTHRRTLLGEWDGVAWVNDSKATNPHAAVAAVAAYDSVVLIAGGRNKGLDLTPLARAPSVRILIALGEASRQLEAASPPGKYRPADSLAQAVAIADELAVAGDTVLLAPGCASFDMFRDYQERGRVFTALVSEMKGI